MPSDQEGFELVKQGVQSTVEAVLSPFKDVIGRALGPFADHIGGIGGLYGRQWRLEREAAFWEKYRRTVERLGRNPSPVPPKTFFPILHQAFIEDDDALQERWAALPATATTDGNAYQPVFVDISPYSDFSGGELLDSLYAEFLEGYQGYDSALPREAALEHVSVGNQESIAESLINLGYLRAKQWTELFMHGTDISSEARFSDKAKLQIVLDSLFRNQLIRSGRTRAHIGSDAFWLTTLGLRFIEACTTHGLSEG